jgi:ADP-ribosylarginine hydrolase
LIAYDALLWSEGDWEKLCNAGVLHGGDNDSTGAIACAWYGALHGFSGVPKCNYEDLEWKLKLTTAGEMLYKLINKEKK